jgi:hypothetical protein
VSDAPVLYETQDKIGIITLNRPAKLNPINEDMQRLLFEALGRADDDPVTTVVVLREAGLDMVAPLYAAKTEVGLTFPDITGKQGLGAALRWRRTQFEAVERGE